MAIRNETTSDADAEELAVSVDLSPYIRGAEAKVKRLTSPGLDSKNSSAALWAGQSYANGIASGIETVEKLKNGLVRVAGSEGILVFF